MGRAPLNVNPVDQYGNSGLFNDPKTTDLTAADVGAVGIGDSAGGDLAGTFPNPVVDGLLGKALPALATGFPYYDGSAWVWSAGGGGGGGSNLDGGTPSSTYGGTTPIDGGTP